MGERNLVGLRLRLLWPKGPLGDGAMPTYLRYLAQCTW